MKGLITLTLLLAAMAPASAGKISVFASDKAAVTLTGSQVQKAITTKMPSVNQRWLGMVVRTRLRSKGIYRITGVTHGGKGFVTVRDSWGQFCFSVNG